MDWLTTLPPLVAILVAVWKREVILALFVALLCAEFIMAGGQPLAALIAAVDRLTAVFASAGNTRILLFSLLIGALLALIRHSGGVNAFVHYLLARNIAANARATGVITTLIGVLIFIETYISALATGIFARSLFDRFHMSRARLAYIVDSTSSPVSVLILLNGWGAYVLGLLEGYGLENTTGIMLASIPLNFYALITLLMVFYTAWSNRVFFTLAAHERHATAGVALDEEEMPGKAHYFLVPLGVMILSFVAFMWLTGAGNLVEGSGSASVLYAVLLAIFTACLILRIDSPLDSGQLKAMSFQGMAELLPLVTIILLALALGSSLQDLGTGRFIAGMVSDTLPPWLIAPIIFIAAGLISFTTGTSWGTFGILVPVALPIAAGMDLSPSLLLAAVLGGGVFGDHCSPISDSTVLASLAAGCDHLEHVRTQLPYALIAAGLSLPLFVLFSM